MNLSFCIKKNIDPKSVVGAFCQKKNNNNVAGASIRVTCTGDSIPCKEEDTTFPSINSKPRARGKAHLSYHKAYTKKKIQWLHQLQLLSPNSTVPNSRLVSLLGQHHLLFR